MKGLRLLLFLLGSAGSSAIMQAQQNEFVFSTPAGKQDSITVADGMKIWLNAKTTLRYPKTVTKNDSFHLEGEACFATAKHMARVPVIYAGHLQVQGDKDALFTVNNYPGEDSCVVTAVEKKLKVWVGNQYITLKEGERALIGTTTGAVTVMKVDKDDAVAWKDGFFAFSNTELHTIMREISRWYDVTVTYDGTVTAKHFSGMFSRSNTLDAVLKLLELTGDIHFKNGNGTVTVSQ